MKILINIILLFTLIIGINAYNYEIIEHTIYNQDVIYYKNSLNQSVEMPLIDFIDYFVYQIYGNKKFPSKIEKVERKGETIKFKVSLETKTKGGNENE